MSMKMLIVLAFAQFAHAQTPLPATVTEGATNESVNRYKTYYPFVNVVNFGQAMRISLPNGLFSDTLLKTLVLDKVQLKDKRGKLVVTAKNPPAAATLGDFVLTPKKPLANKELYRGLRGVASFHLSVPSQYQILNLTRPGESAGGWTFTKLNRGVAQFTCANGAKCADDEIVLLQGDKVVEPKSIQRGASDAQVTLAGLVTTFRFRRPSQTKIVSWTSKVVPDSSIEPKINGVFYFEKPRPIDSGICTQTPAELVKMFKFEPKRVENPSMRDQLHIDLKFSGPNCLNARLAKVYKALELHTAKRDLTGKISGLAGDAEIGTTVIEMDMKESSFDVSKHPLLDPGDATALREVLQFRGVYNVHFPQVALKSIELDSDLAEKQGYVVRRAKKLWVLKARGVTDQTEFIASNGLAMKPQSIDTRAGVSSMIFPVEPRDVRQVVEISASDILVPVSGKVGAGYKEIPAEPNPKDVVVPAAPAEAAPAGAPEPPVDGQPEPSPQTDGPLGDAESATQK